MERVENRMVIDSEWPCSTENKVNEILKEPGFHERGTGIFVPRSNAYEYALERSLNGTEEDIKEFREMLVEWFYSGNWVREE